MKKIIGCSAASLILFVGAALAGSNKDYIAELYLFNVKSANRVLCATVEDDYAAVAASVSPLSDDFSTLTEASQALANYAARYKELDAAMKRYTESDEYLRYNSVIVAEFKKAERFKARMPNLLQQIGRFLKVMEYEQERIAQPMVNGDKFALRTSGDIYAHARFACGRLRTALDNYWVNKK